jgi:thioredoxin-related protein
MKKIALMLLACCAAFQLGAAETAWTTDVPQALAQAKKENKIVLLDFTGSDWCSWCMKFKKEALDTTEFKDYAGKNVVLVEVDFPNKKPQSAELKSANKALGDKYKVSGYPTFVVLNQDGKEIGRQEGYQPGGPKAFIAELDGFKSKN